MPDEASESNKPKLIDRVNAHDTYVESICVTRSDSTDIIVSGSSDGTVHWWQTGTAHSEKRERFSSKPIASVDVSADGRWVTAGSHDGSVWLWDTSQTPAKAVQLNTGSPVHVVRIDATGRWLIAGCADGVTRRWDLRWVKLLALDASPPSGDDRDGTIETMESPVAA